MRGWDVGGMGAGTGADACNTGAACAFPGVGRAPVIDAAAEIEALVRGCDVGGIGWAMGSGSGADACNAGTTCKTCARNTGEAGPLWP